ncbi:MAG: DUF4345 family protein [Pseudomonadota bacterium]
MNQKPLLQIAVALAGLVPVTAGAAGAFWPEVFFLPHRSGGLTHGAYLSGLLLGIGLCFWSLVPTLERQTRAVTLLTAIVFLGGLARLAVAARLGAWGPSVVFPLVMELGVTPALCLWQRRVARPSLLGPE